MNSFHELTATINRIFAIKTEEDAKEVFEEITTSPEYQNETNIKLLYQAIFTANDNLYCLNNQIFNNLLLRMIDQYSEHLYKEIEKFKLPNNLFIDEIRNGKLSRFQSEFMRFDDMNNADALDVYKENAHIMTIQIVNKGDEYRFIEFNNKKGKINISPDVAINITFHDINTFPISFKVYQVKADKYAQMIKDDNVDMLTSLYEQIDMTAAKYIPDLPTRENYVNGMSLCDLSLVYGAVKCFKYLYLNGHFKPNIVSWRYLIQGNNLEIFRTILFETDLINKNKDIILINAIIFHNTEIAIFMINNYIFEKHTLHRFIAMAISCFEYSLIIHIKENKLMPKDAEDIYYYILDDDIVNLSNDVLTYIGIPKNKN